MTIIIIKMINEEFFCIWTKNYYYSKHYYELSNDTDDSSFYYTSQPLYSTEKVINDQQLITFFLSVCFKTTKSIQCVRLSTWM